MLSGKKAAYAEYREARKQMQDLLIARKNVEAILGVEQEEERRQQDRHRSFGVAASTNAEITTMPFPSATKWMTVSAC